jgi:hypothetical protein
MPLEVVRSARVIAGLTGERIGRMIADVAGPVLADREREEIARKVRGRWRWQRRDAPCRRCSLAVPERRAKPRKRLRNGPLV